MFQSYQPYQQYQPYQNNSAKLPDPNWIYVPDVSAVDKVGVQPNQKAWIMVQGEPVFALKVADAMGLVKTEFYKFEKYELPQNEYVTAAQLTDIINKFKEEIRESIISASSSSSEPLKPI